MVGNSSRCGASSTAVFRVRKKTRLPASGERTGRNSVVGLLRPTTSMQHRSRSKNNILAGIVPKFGTTKVHLPPHMQGVPCRDCLHSNAHSHVVSMGTSIPHTGRSLRSLTGKPKVDVGVGSRKSRRIFFRIPARGCRAENSKTFQDRADGILTTKLCLCLTL